MNQRIASMGPFAFSLPRQTTAPLFGKVDKPWVVVLDQTRRPIIDLDGDGLPDISHGQLIADFIKTHLGSRAEVKLLEARRSHYWALASLRKVQQWISQGKPIKALNISYAPADTSLENLSRWSGTQITTDNLGKTGSKLLHWMETAQPSQPRQQLASMRRQISQLRRFPGNAQQATHLEQQADILFEKRVLLEQTFPWLYALRNLLNDKSLHAYVAAGNMGQVNLTSLVPNTSVVGALNQDGGFASFSTHHGLVNRFAIGEWPVQEVRQIGRLTGYHVGASGKLVYPLSRLSDKKLGKPLASLQASATDLQAIEAYVRKGTVKPPDIPLQQVVFPFTSYLAWSGMVLKKADTSLRDCWISLGHRADHVVFYRVDELGNLYRPPEKRRTISGSSFATPQALVDNMST